MRKCYLLVSVLVFFIAISSNAQYSQWEKAIGGTNFDEGMSVVATSDGGFAITGTTESYGNGGEDVYVIKLDSTGKQQWNRTIGGSGTDIGYSIIQSKDKGYAIAGYTNSYGDGGYDVYVIKLDSLGNLQWTKAIGGNDDDYGHSIVQANDGGFIIAGTAGFNGNGAYYLKLDSLGNVVWEKVINPNNANPASDEEFYSVTKTNDGGYAFAGCNRDWTYTDTKNVYTVKTDSLGNIQWSAIIGGSGGNDIAYSIIQSIDGGYVTVGQTNSYGRGSSDMYIVKYNSSGTVLWTRTVGGTGVDIAYSVVQCNDGSYLVAGCTNSYGAGGYDVYLVKIDSTSNILWTKTLGGTGNDYAYSLIKTTSQGYAIAGSTTSSGNGNADIYIIKLDLFGNTCLMSGSTGDTSAGGNINAGSRVYTFGYERTGGILDSGGIELPICSADTCSIPLSVAYTNLKCCGANNGTAKVNISGGVSPFTYNWSPSGGSNDSANGLSAGTYVVTVYDSVGCIGFGLFTITQPPCLRDSILASPSLGCNCHGTIEVFAYGGTKPYTYLWSNGRTNDTLHNISSGEYMVRVCDSNGCCITDSIFVPVGDPIHLSQTNVSCYGECNGTASVVTWGWNGYLWSPGGETTASVSGLCAGTYTLTITNLDTACSANYIITITQPPQLIVSATLISNVTCYGGHNGSASSNASGGTPPYTYRWSDGESGATASELSAGTAVVTVTDANGCTAAASVAITQPTPLSVTINNSSSPCDIVQTLNAAVSGGTPPYTYSWGYGSTTNSEADYVSCVPFGIPEDEVYVTDNNGCSASNSILLYSPVEWSPGATQTNVSCYAGNNGSITMQVCGGGEFPTYTYHWNYSNATSNNNTYTVSNLSAGSYTVWVSDGNGCYTNTIAITITQPPPLIVSTNIIATIPCHGASIGSASASASGGESPYTYLWLPSGETTDTAVSLSAGTYTVNIKDNNGCTGSATVSITQPNALNVSVSVTTNITCYGGATGSASSTVSGGTPAYTYSWSNGGSNSTATELSAGTYTLTVSDACGSLSATASVTISQPNNLSVSASAEANVTCNGLSNGKASSSVSGGTVPYTYSWSNSQTTSTVSSLSAGTYTLNVTDKNGCTGSVTVYISQPALLTATIGTIKNVLCNGGSAGKITVITGGGTIPYNYDWMPLGDNLATATGLTVGCYTVTVRDGNGCTATATACITQPNSLSVSASITDNVLCNEGNTGSASSTVSGGALPYTYSWSNSQTTPNIRNLSAGTYTLSVMDNNGCTGSATVSITQPNSLSVSANTVTNISCNRGNNGSVSSTVSGGTTPYTYSWSNSQTTPNISSLSAGTYTLNITDSNGCTGSAIAIITQPSTLIIITDSIPDDGNGGCIGAAWVKVIGGVSPYTYSWADGNTTDSISKQCKGSYCCTVTDANGCIDSACVIITSTTGIDNIVSNTGQISIYPNPNNGVFTIEYSGINGQSLVNIYNVLGQRVYSASLNLTKGSNYEINISDKAAGVYFYRVVQENGELLGEGKLVVEH